MTINVGFRSIQSGAVVNGGNDIVLHAKADDGEANLLLPAEEASGLAILLLQLQQLSRQARAKDARFEAAVLEGVSIGAAPDPLPDRDILQIEIASDAVAEGAKAPVLRLSLPKGSLKTFAQTILRSADAAG